MKITKFRIAWPWAGVPLLIALSLSPGVAMAQPAPHLLQHARGAHGGDGR